jgi:hypothetical protein
VTSADDNGDGNEPDSVPWHYSTAKVAGASVAALAAIGLIVGGVTFVSRQVEQPPEAPMNFVDPSFSETSDSATPTTTETITSTVPPVTSEIDAPSSPESTSSSTDTTSSSSDSTTRRSRPGDDDDTETSRTSRSRPRLNETRTLYPRP